MSEQNVRKNARRYVRKGCQKYVGKGCQKICQTRMSEEMSEDMSIEMSDNMSDKNVKRYVRGSRPRPILAQRMSEFVTNMFQYDVTVGITRSEVIFLLPTGRFCAYSSKARWALSNSFRAEINAS